MDSVATHPLRCLVDAACMASVGLTVMGWLPLVLASIASLLASIHYGIWVYDRIYHNPHRPR